MDQSSAPLAGDKDEEPAAAAAAESSSSSSSAWQGAAENASLHALVLKHMCQQSRHAQTAPDEADGAVSCSYDSSGATQVGVLPFTAQIHVQSFNKVSLGVVAILRVLGSVLVGPDCNFASLSVWLYLAVLPMCHVVAPSLSRQGELVGAP